MQQYYSSMTLGRAVGWMALFASKSEVNKVKFEAPTLKASRCAGPGTSSSQPHRPQITFHLHLHFHSPLAMRSTVDSPRHNARAPLPSLSGASIMLSDSTPLSMRFHLSVLGLSSISYPLANMASFSYPPCLVGRFFYLHQQLRSLF